MLGRLYSNKLTNFINDSVNKLILIYKLRLEKSFCTNLTHICCDNSPHKVIIFRSIRSSNKFIFKLYLLIITKSKDVLKNILELLSLKYKIFISVSLHNCYFKLGINKFCKSFLRTLAIAIYKINLRSRRKWRWRWRPYDRLTIIFYLIIVSLA